MHNIVTDSKNNSHDLTQFAAELKLALVEKPLLIATSNQGKFREIMEVFEAAPFEIVSLLDVGISGDCDETEDTFEGNAMLKARHYAGLSGLITLAEDSGILVDALPGQLGVKTRRWGAGAEASDEQWIAYFLDVMKDVPLEKRGAKFVCVSAVAVPDSRVKIFKGETVGVITQGLEAPIYGGLPLSACFKPEGFDTVYSALEKHEKNRISHRGKAIRKVFEFLA